MSSGLIVGTAIAASLAALLMLGSRIVRRVHRRKGMAWSDNAPRKATRTIDR